MSTSDPRDQSSRVFVGGVPPGSDPKALEKVTEVHFCHATSGDFVVTFKAFRALGKYYLFTFQLT